VASAVTFYVASDVMGLASAVDLLNQVQAGAPLYITIPLVLVLIVAIKGMSTIACLGAGILSAVGNACLADEMAKIVTIGPIIKKLLEDNVEGSEEDMYALRLRNATFGDALGVFGSQLVQWHVYIDFYLGIANTVYPFDASSIIRCNFSAVIAALSILVLILTGLDRFIHMFALPYEPRVNLKKQKAA
jgi:Na+/H+ antiporter NhaC